MPETIQLPDVVKFVMPAQYAAVILNALQEFGPYKAVEPVLKNLQQQLVSQQVRDEKPVLPRAPLPVPPVPNIPVTPPVPANPPSEADTVLTQALTGTDANGSEVDF